ncbi:MAG: ATP-binding protein, partial [Nitrosopumilus sp.]
AEEISSGNLDSPIKAKGSYEIVKLSESMEQMRKTIKKQLEELKEIDIAKTKFLGMISHEFRNPLFPIIGFSETLLTPKLIGELNSKQLDALKTILRNAKRLHSMINELLDVQKLELDVLEFHYGKFKVDELMSQICKKFESKIIETKIQLVNTTRESIVIRSDELRIKQVLSHLIDNAIDFVPKENGKIEICVQEADDFVSFFVKDNGVGILKEKQENLFKKFYQVSQGHTRKHGGVGLSISICKGIITKLGGKIWVESEPGKGTTFNFNIPKIRE